MAKSDSIPETESGFSFPNFVVLKIWLIFHKKERKISQIYTSKTEVSQFLCGKSNRNFVKKQSKGRNAPLYSTCLRVIIFCLTFD
jgi:hypothetical protein